MTEHLERDKYANTRSMSNYPVSEDVLTELGRH